jgi:hypothetical protein
MSLELRSAVKWQGWVLGLPPLGTKYICRSGRYPAAWPEVPATAPRQGPSCPGWRGSPREWDVMHGTCELVGCPAGYVSGKSLTPASFTTNSLGRLVSSRVSWQRDRQAPFAALLLH